MHLKSSNAVLRRFVLSALRHTLSLDPTSWVVTSNPTGAQGALPALLLTAAAISIAYASLKLYDEPVRR